MVVGPGEARCERSGTPQVWAQPEFRLGEMSQSHPPSLCVAKLWRTSPAFLHVGQAWSLAHSPTKSLLMLPIPNRVQLKIKIKPVRKFPSRTGVVF